MPALTDREMDAILEDDSRPNVPARLDGTTAVQTFVSPDEARRRREVMSGMLAAGLSMDRIIIQMGLEKVTLPNGTEQDGFAMSEDQVVRLINEVRGVWEQEDLERAVYNKSAAVRRHQDHIQKASKKGQWPAVAMLETNLARIQGTNEPLEIHVNDDSRVNDALVRVLGMANPEKLREMVTQERERFIEAHGEEVSSK